MGVNLVPSVDTFSISQENFPANSHDVQDGCVTPGSHKVMRFNMKVHNIGNADLVVGDPNLRPDLFEFSAAHGHNHFKQFNEYFLYDVQGNLAMPGKKQGFCLADVEKDDPNAGPMKFDPSTCTYQGISAGWADVYDTTLPCQYILLDGVPDGDYTLVAKTNAGQLVPEDNFEDNSVCQGLRIQGPGATPISPPVRIDQLTPSLVFNDIPEGETTVRAAVYAIHSCAAVHLEVIAGPTVVSGPPGTTFGLPLGGSATAPEVHSMQQRQARIWISYTGTQPNAAASGSVTIRCTETGQQFVIPITANTIARPTVGVVMVLDQSGSMLYDSGLAAVGLPKRNDVLKFAAPTFVDVLQEKNGIGVVAFDQDAYDRMAVAKVGSASAFDQARSDARTHIQQHTPNPNGSTSIGDGVEHGHNMLQPVTDYQAKAMVVLTDGEENTPKYIADVASQINDRVFAIGLGTPEQINPVALTALTNGSGGYMLLTGNMGPDNLFRLSKYYLQILAGVTNQNIVVDPEGYLASGQTHRIPFVLNEADITTDVILLSAAPPPTFEFAVETSAGDVIDQNVASGLPMTEFVQGDNVSYYRMTLPVVLNGQAADQGTWNALLSINEEGFKRYLYTLREEDKEEFHRVETHGLRYSVSVHSLSSLRMDARLTQSSNEPGAEVTVRAVLTEYGLPVEQRASVRLEIERPDHTTLPLTMTEVDGGVFEVQFPASASGVYTVRALADGWTLRGKTFTRERLLTAAVWKGGDQPSITSATDPGRQNEHLCELLECLLEVEGVRRALEKHEINSKELRRCLLGICRPRHINEAPPQGAPR